jgi:tetratricopeptide (TPR) repeat protein
MKCPIRGGDMPDTPPHEPDIGPQTTSVTSTSGGVNVDAERDITIGGDVVGRDKITQVEQINTGGGTYISESVEVNDHGTFAGRDMRTVNVGGDVNSPIILGDVYGEVHLHAAVPIEIPSPPPPPSLPAIAQFVGREAELAFYTQQLIEQRWVVISGMAGTGKTALAIELARRISPSDRIFWHAFHQGEGIQVVIWQLAGFLARRGLEDLWQMLQLNRQTRGQLPPTETLVDYLVQLVQDQDILLCFDDIQLVSDELLLDQLFRQLRNALATGNFKIIATSQGLPDFATAFELKVLAGLNGADTRQLLIARDLVLPDALVTRLHSRTGGNAQFLMLAIEILRRAKDPERVIERLAEADDIERYLVDGVYRRLSTDEQAVMSAVAVLLGYPAGPDAIEAVMDGGGIRLTLRDLCNRYLLIPSEGEAGREYGQHAIVRAFFYELLGQRDRKVMHLRAGRYYEAGEIDLLKAAVHYQRAEDHTKAAQLATTDVWGSINLGQILVLQDLLEHFSAQEFEAELWVKVSLARGQVYAVQGMGERARESYQQGYSLLISLPDTVERRELRARACYGMGELMEQDSPQDALDWLRLGLSEVGESKDFERATLEIKAGTVHMYLGNYLEALTALDNGLKRLPAKNGQLRSNALRDLGVICFLQGNVEQAKEYTVGAIKVSESLRDHFQTANLLSNLGVYKFAAANWTEAIADWQQALALAERLGNEKVKVSVGVNLGAAYIYTGDEEKALNQLAQSLILARKNNLHVFESTIQFRLADLYIRLGKWDSAINPLNEAEKLAIAIDAQGNLPEVYSSWAEVKLAQGQTQEALNYAQQSVKLARELGKELELGISLRVLGQVFFADSQRQLAMEAYSESFTLLDHQDPYESARTQMQWGLALLSSINKDQGMDLLKGAQATFKQLGAQRDLVNVERILRSGG